MPRLLPIAIAYLILAAAVCGQCAGNGLTLSTTGGRLGDPFSITLAGTPGVSGLLAWDASAGPVATPLGTVCLGLSPALDYRPFTLDASGTFGSSGILPVDHGVPTQSLFLQAGAADATQPGGFALSNGTSLNIRPPRAYFINPGSWTSSVPGSWVAYDALSQSVGPVFMLPSPFVDGIAIPALGWIAFALYDGTVRAYDGTTGALKFTYQGPPYFTWMQRLALDGTSLIVTHTNGFNATLRTFELPLGTPGISVPTPLGVGYPIVVPGAGFVYLPSGPDLVPMNLATGALSPVISIGAAGSTTWIRNGTILYGLVYATGGSGIGVNAVDTTTNTPFFATPVSVPISTACCLLDSSFRYGPGSLGPALFIRDFANSVLLELSPQTFTLTAPPISVPPDLTYFEPSNGGSEWLMTTSPQAAYGSVLTMKPSTHAISTVGVTQSLYPGSSVRAFKSATLNKAIVISGNQVYSLETDPTPIVQLSVLLPIVFFFVIVD